MLCKSYCSRRFFIIPTIQETLVKHVASGILKCLVFSKRYISMHATMGTKVEEEERR